MYSNTGYIIRNTDIDYEDRDNALSIKSCGIYRLIHQPILTCTRPKGRRDYQLLYIASGRAFFLFHGQETEVPVGHMVLFRPGETQIYHYKVEDQPEVCWVHFSGHEAASLMEQIGFAGQSVVKCGSTLNYLKLFRQMIREMQQQRPCFEEMLTLYLRQIFMGIRRCQVDFSNSLLENQSGMEATIDYFNENYAHTINIEAYAKNQHMSVCWFIRTFKKYMNMTPMQYITSIRINKAKELLRCTDYSIQEISGIVGYENQLYFSRIFRKNVGLSPSEYRSR